MKRVIYSDDGVLSDLTYPLMDFYSSTQAFSFVAADDNLYIGSLLPFNNVYIGMGSVVNATASVMSIKIWDGSAWNSAVEVYDGTSSGGKSLAQSGIVRFVPNKDKSWSMEDTTTITELSGVTIYDRYWIQLSFSADLTANVALNWIGNIFSTDSDLDAEFPDLVRSNVMVAFKTGKTNWNDQHQLAAIIIEKDLISKGKIQNSNQILTIEDLTLAAVQKVAAIIYNALGDDYTDQFIAAEKEYRVRLSKSYVKVDTNGDARLSPLENNVKVGRLYR